MRSRVDHTAAHPLAVGTLDLLGLPGEHRLVEQHAVAPTTRPSTGTTSPWTDDHQVTDRDLGESTPP